jgi:DNA-directed RNA polymerase specialized sigma24 family protein
MTRTEARLLGSPEAFRELYEHYAERIHGYHLRRTRNPDVAHDLTAETFAQA